jgi:tetratricopeptide (TPR) repeat protein
VAAEQARALLDVGRNEDAGKAALEGLHGEPNNARLMGLLAIALDRDGHVHNARHWAERSLSFDPQQAWVHSVRARAILDGAGHPQEAVESAWAAVNLDPHESAYRYTLTRTLLAADNRQKAEEVACSIRGIDPSSALGPLAEALVELDGVKTVVLRKWYLVVLVIFLTKGLALVGMAIWWLWHFARRFAPLRRADRLLLEALRLDPANAAVHSIAAEVAHLRFRYVQSVDGALAAAALDAGLVDADDLARTITRRTSGAASAAFVVWWVFLAVVHAVGHLVGIVATIGGLALIAAVYWLDQAPTRRLPAGLARRVRRRWGLPATVSVVAALMIWTGVGYLTIVFGLAVAAILCGSIVAAFAAVLLVKLYLARRPA